MGPGDAQALQNYFIKMQKIDAMFFYVVDMDDEGRLRNVFWADCRSRAAYSYFGDATHKQIRQALCTICGS